MTPFIPVKPSLTSFLEALRTSGGLRFGYTIETREADPASAKSSHTEVILFGPDTHLLLERNGELLHALESLAAAILRLEPDQAEQLSFDAAGFKAGREAVVARLAEDAVAAVRTTGKPWLFAPMNSRERRLLHLALVPSGFATASSGIGSRRFVVLYPPGQTPEPERFDQPGSQHASARSQRDPRQQKPFRNQPGYKPADPRRLPPSRLAAGDVLPATPPSAQSGDQQDSESLGNRGNTGDPATTTARLDSIRRAFRKR